MRQRVASFASVMQTVSPALGLPINIEKQVKAYYQFQKNKNRKIKNSPKNGSHSNTKNANPNAAVKLKKKITKQCHG